MENSELLARVLRSIIDTLDSKHTFHPIWIAGEKLEMIATRPTDSIFSIGRMIYYKMETADIQMLAYEWQISGVDPFIADQILELTGGHYISVEFCLDFFEEKNYIPTAKFLKEALLNQPLFNGFVNHQEHLKTFLKQDIINMPTTYLAFFPIIKTLYFDGLLKKVTENQFTWVNPIIREIGTEMMNNIPV